MRVFVTACLCLYFLTNAAVAAERTVRVGVLNFGTVNWELDVIDHHGLDEANGIDLKVVPLGSKNATAVALQGGAVDIIVTDWIWVSRQRAEDRPYAFFPYSLTVGALFVRPDAGIAELSDLRGKKLGIAGGPVDKSWLLLRAYTRDTLGLELKDEVEPAFAAPPLLNQLMLSGDLPAVLNFWHYGARLEAQGMKSLTTAVEMIRGLGIDTSVPLLGWVFEDAWAEEHRDALLGFLKASYSAKQILAQSDEEWQRIRDLTKAESDAILASLRDSYRAGIPRRFADAELEATRRVFAILAAEGGAELVGRSTALSPGTFWQGASPQALHGE